MRTVVAFDPPDLQPVLEALDPKGWVNLQPHVEVEDVPESSSGYFGIFGARGPVVPLATWHPGDRSAGVQHATGPKVAKRIEVPVGWRVVQDHPKRGLVVKVPAGVADDEVLHWLVAVGTTLCPLPISRWGAEVHGR